MSSAKAVVTGATNGIGEAIARRLAGEGLTVVLVGRDWGRLRAAQQRIHATVPDADLALERAEVRRLPEGIFTLSARQPGQRPTLPPTILTEAVAQVGAILILSKPENRVS